MQSLGVLRPLINCKLWLVSFLCVRMCVMSVSDVAIAAGGDNPLSLKYLAGLLIAPFPLVLSTMWTMMWIQLIPIS